MAIRIDPGLTSSALRAPIERVLDVSATKILSLEKTWEPARGTPVFTAAGRYTSRGWTEWTQGFQFGSALLQFDATGDPQFLELGRRHTLARMAPHVSNVGVHDHGFNNVSTYGNLWRLTREQRMAPPEPERQLYELALKVSGAIQAARWTSLPDGLGYIYSFNGPHSLFVDTLRSLRSLAIAHQLGHVLMGEGDRPISLLHRLLTHAQTTATYAVYFGNGRDAYDVPGRVAHESLFNLNNGTYRCPSSQQGYSPFTTWTRGLAWAILGFAEQLEFLLSGSDLHPSISQRHAGSGTPVNTGDPPDPQSAVMTTFLKAARVTAEYYLDQACADGIPMWDTGAPNLHRLGDFRDRPSDPFNGWEPVDSSAAAIAAQGLLRLARTLGRLQPTADTARYRQAGLTIARTLFQEPYLATDANHQGLILHSVYHRPNGWDFVSPGQSIPNGESSMWGDYHARELALIILRDATGQPYPTFFAPLNAADGNPVPADSDRGSA